MLRMRASASTRLTGCSTAKPCPAVDLHGVVGGGPGDAGGDQLGHAGLQVAAAALVLGARRRTRPGGARPAARPPSWPACWPPAGSRRSAAPNCRRGQGVVERQVQRVLGHADGAGRGLDAGALEGRHQLDEALALLAAQQVGVRAPRSRRRRSRIPSCRDSRSPPISPPLMPGAGKGSAVGSARLLGQEHRQAPVVLRRRIGADQQGHQVGAGGVGDPGLGAGDLPGRRRRGRRGCAGSPGPSPPPAR